MSWLFPLKNYKYSIPEGDHPGSFLKERKHHFHEGVDLYGKDGQEVYSVENGTVHKILNFTGEKANSPWWNNTDAIIIKGSSGFVLYGEIKVNSKIKEGDCISQGQLIGKITPVLKKRKNNPIAMLHFEWYSKEVNNPIELVKNKRNRDKTDSLYKEVKKYGLLDPTNKLKESLNRKENILLMICGSISAYKAPDIARGFINNGQNVKVVLSKGAEHFVKKEVFDYLGIESYSSNDDFKNKNVLHIDLARWADKVLIAPASANTIAKLSYGMADDLLSSIFLSLKKDVIKIILPIMNTQMLNQKVTQDNLKRLEFNYNLKIVKPDSGLLACGEIGEGKLPNTESIVYITNLLTNNNKKNKEVVITAGATIAPIDSIRYVTNPAKGATGLLLAEKYLKEGYNVTVICNKNSLDKFKTLERHPNYKRVEVSTTRDLLNTVKKLSFDIYISTMAVSDLEFKNDGKKLKKKDLNVLKPNTAPDVLKYVLENKKNSHNIVVGFAAETKLTKKVLDEKLSRKPVDLLVANEADGGFKNEKRKGFGTSHGVYKLISKRGIEDYSISKKDLVEKIYSNIKEIFEK